MGVGLSKAKSRFDETDWKGSASGGLTTPSQTMDGQAPTSSYQILKLVKTQQSVVDQRSFQVVTKEDDTAILYATVAVPGTTKAFDVFFGGQSWPLFRVSPTDASHDQWEILSYTPAFPGQAPADTSSATKPLYRKAQILISRDKCHGHVHPILPDGKDTYSYSQTPTLLVEEVESPTSPQYQSSPVPSDLNGLSAMLLTAEMNHAPLSPLNNGICAWWTWEKDHVGIELHLAAQSDVALHVMVALVTNMVTVERMASQE